MDLQKSAIKVLALTLSSHSFILGLYLNTKSIAVALLLDSSNSLIDFCPLGDCLYRFQVY